MNNLLTDYVTKYTGRKIHLRWLLKHFLDTNFEWDAAGSARHTEPDSDPDRSRNQRPEVKPQHEGRSVDVKLYFFCFELLFATK